MANFSDNFNRSNAANWGTDWDFVYNGGSNSENITSNVGVLVAASQAINYYNGLTTKNAEVAVKVYNGAYFQNGMVVLRYTATGNSYNCHLRTGANAAGGQIYVRTNVSWSETTITTYNMTVSERTWYWVKAKIEQVTEGTNIYMKAWLTTDSEPAGWQVTLTTDTTVGLNDTVGYYGLGAGAGDTISFDDYELTDTTPAVSAKRRFLMIS